MNMFNKGACFRYGRSKRCSLQRERETLGHLVLVCRGSIAIFVQSIAKFEILNLYKIRINGTVCNSLVWFILFIFNRSLRDQILQLRFGEATIPTNVRRAQAQVFSVGPENKKLQSESIYSGTRNGRRGILLCSKFLPIRCAFRERLQNLINSKTQFNY